MNGRPIIWALATAVVVFVLRKALARLEKAEPILPKLNSYEGSPGTASEKSQEVVVTIMLTSGGMGDKDERERMIALQHLLSAAIENASVGEFDGDEFGGGTCTMYMYGPSAERLLAVTLPILREFHAPPGSYVVTRSAISGEDEPRIPLEG